MWLDYSYASKCQSAEVGWFWQLPAGWCCHSWAQWAIWRGMVLLSIPKRLGIVRSDNHCALWARGLLEIGDVNFSDLSFSSDIWICEWLPLGFVWKWAKKKANSYGVSWFSWCSPLSTSIPDLHRYSPLSILIPDFHVFSPWKVENSQKSNVLIRFLVILWMFSGDFWEENDLS